MAKHLLIFTSLLLLFSCNNKQENKSANADATVKQDTLAPLQITALADLPDSLQPKTILLEKTPKPLIVAVPKTSGGSYSITDAKGEARKINLEPPATNLLPVLKNDKGEIIKDKDGNPFTLGEGGISSFTNFTTDNGLALDAISSACIDHFGNLWFGTYGGGVSRYDGKSFTNFTTAQGLAYNMVYSITEDKTGNLWFGTDGGGVSRYDGKSFTNLTTAQGLANNTVRSITEDKTGNLWFGTQGGGVSRYDPSASLRAGSKSFTNFTTAQGLANNSVYSITEDKTGNLWFGTAGGGVSRYDGKSFTNFTTTQGLANNTVRSITEDKTGNLWFGTDGGGVSRYDPSASLRAGSKSFTNFTTAQGLANNTVRSITEDKTGNLWFGTDGGGVSRYDGKSFTNFTTGQGLANNIMRSITEDKTGNLWFGTNGGGVSRYDGKSFNNFTTAQGLANNTVWNITEDKTGNLWFGTQGGGVGCYDGKSFTNFTTAQGLANNTVLSITEDKTGNLWFGTNRGGVSRYDGKSFTNFTTAQGLANNVVNSITKGKTGNLWFGTNNGGVSRYDGKSFTNFTTTQGLANNTVLSITEDKTGNLWFGTDGGGVSRYDGKSFTNFTTAQGLANNTVLSITEDKTGNLWFGTAEGLSLLSEEDRKKLQEKPVLSGVEGNDKVSTKENVSKNIFKNFTTLDGLPDNFVTQVVEGNNGKLYVGTNFGICELMSKDAEWIVGKIFNSSTGYPVKDVNIGQNAMFKDSNGILWIATGSDKTGLVRFDPSALHQSTEPPALIIQSIKVNEENICWYNLQGTGVGGRGTSEEKEKHLRNSALKKLNNDSSVVAQQEIITFGKLLSEQERDSMQRKYGDIQFDGITKFYPLPEHLVLPYQHNHILFEYAAIEPSKPYLVKYQYMLEGYDKEWSPVTNKTSVSFGNIYEGTYKFKLKAKGTNDVWTEQVTFSFQVLPPLHRTWWAYLIYAISSIALILLIFRWRTASLKQHRNELEQMVKKRTAEVVTQKERSEELLLNILPAEVAEELKRTGQCHPKTFSMVTVMFADFKDFTSVSEKVSAELLVDEIHTCFSAFDNMLQKHRIEKIKTIGDAYLCASGLPESNYTHAVDMLNAAFEIRNYMQQRKKEKEARGEIPFELRIGIHTGPVVAGIVGVKKYAYDIWGDTVNLAARMEQSGEAGKVNISGSTYELVKGKFNCTHRGKIEAKHKGEIDMYFVEEI